VRAQWPAINVTTSYLQGDDMRSHCINCAVSMCLTCVEDLHRLLPHSRSHTVVDYHERPTESLVSETSFPDIKDLPAWFRYACKHSKEGHKGGGSSIASNTMKLVPRPGDRSHAANAKSTVALKVLKTEKAKSKGKGMPPGAIEAATKMLSIEEFLEWDPDHWSEACIACAKVFAVDDALIQAVQTVDAPLSDSRNWSLNTRISNMYTKVSEFKKWKLSQAGRKSKLKQPDIQDTSRILERIRLELFRLEDSMGLYSFGETYQAVSLKYEVVGIYNFCRWCTAQLPQQKAFLLALKKKYDDVCKSLGRDPRTPDQPKSWPPVVVIDEPSDDLDHSADDGPQQ
jgi:hypothetical protein